MNPQDPKYQQKSKAISSAEPNYFVHFAMRHPVQRKYIIGENSSRLPLFSLCKKALKTISSLASSFQSSKWGIITLL